MGQRLVLDVVKDGKRVCNIYYHWSAYTLSALAEALNLLTRLDSQCEDEKKKDLPVRVVHVIEKNTGTFPWIPGVRRGGMSETEAFKERYPGEDFLPADDTLDRSFGLVCISEDGMKENDRYAEGSIVVDFDKKTVSSYVFFMADEDDVEDILVDENIPDTDFCFADIPFDRLEQMLCDLHDMIVEKDHVVFRDKEGTLLCAIY